MRMFMNLWLFGLLAVTGAIALAEGPESAAAKQALLRHERATKQSRQEYLRKLVELDRALIRELEEIKRTAMDGGDADEADRLEPTIADARDRMEKFRAEITAAAAPPGPAFPTRAFFTSDDGETLFVDRIDHIPPFEHEGKQAVRAHVFTCDGGQTRFVAYMERFTAEAQQTIDQARDSGQTERNWEDLMAGIEYRKPGPQGRWVKATDFAAVAEITSVRCPDGSVNNLRPLLP